MKDDRYAHTHGCTMLHTLNWVLIHVFIQCHLAILHTHQAWTIDSLHNDHGIMSVHYYTTWCKVCHNSTLNNILMIINFGCDRDIIGIAKVKEMWDVSKL